MQAPSKAPLWSVCALAGSLLAGTQRAGYVSPHAEKEESESRREGKAASWLAARLIRNEVSPAGALNLIAPNGWVITSDMVDHVMQFRDYVANHAIQLIPGNTPVVLGKEIQGHLDDTIAAWNGFDLHVFDLRYGWRIAEPCRDPTLMCYGLALGQDVSTHDVTVHIFQPRPFHPDGPGRSWTIPRTERQQWRDWLIHTARMGNLGIDVAQAGAHCERHGCPGRTSCATLRQLTGSNHERIRGHGLDRKMTPEELAAELAFLEEAEHILKARKAGIEAEAEGRIRGNEFIAGWEVVMRKGQRKFTVDGPTIIAKTGVNPYAEPKLCTPAELERRGANKEVVKTITDTPNIGTKLQRVDARAPERMFKK